MVRRAAAVALIVLPLSGCAHSRFVEHPITSWFAAPPKPAAAPDAAERRCRELANQRRRDMIFEGENEPVQQEVYRSTYARCVTSGAVAR